MDFTGAANAIIAVGRRLDQRGLAPATAGNYSIRLGDGDVAVTVSGSHKGRLGPDQIMRVSTEGIAQDAKKPSAETLLHCLIYAVDASAGAILHTHSIAGVVLSRTLTDTDVITLSGYELLKAYPGIGTHDTSLALPLVDNSQDMAALASYLLPILAGQKPLIPAFYIRGHGLYAWGPTMDAAENIVEASEYLLACEWEMVKLQGRAR